MWALQHSTVFFGGIELPLARKGCSEFRQETRQPIGDDSAFESGPFTNKTPFMPCVSGCRTLCVYLSSAPFSHRPRSSGSGISVTCAAGSPVRHYIKSLVGCAASGPLSLSLCICFFFLIVHQRCKTDNSAYAHTHMLEELSSCSCHLLTQSHKIRNYLENGVALAKERCVKHFYIFHIMS